MKKIDKLKAHREILIECKKLLITYAMGYEIEQKISTYGNSSKKIKVLTLFKKEV